MNVFGSCSFSRDPVPDRNGHDKQDPDPNLVASDLQHWLTVVLLSGLISCDHDQFSALVYAVIKFALPHSAPEAQLLTKIFAGPITKKIVADVEKFYRDSSTFCKF